MGILKSFGYRLLLFYSDALQQSDSRKGCYQALLITDTPVKLQGVEPWVHISQLKKALPDIWSCANTGDLKIKLTRKRSSQNCKVAMPYQEYFYNKKPNNPIQKMGRSPKQSVCAHTICSNTDAIRDYHTK